MAKPTGSTTTGRATRSTRSQSREPELGNELVTASTRRGGRRAAKDAENDLPAVIEESIDEQELRTQLLASAATAQIDGDALRRTSAHTDISGTTAKTSFSKEEIAEMDRDVMIDSLPRLVAAADDLAKFLLPSGEKTSSDLWKNIRTHNTRDQKLFESRQAAFNMLKDNYGSQDYIQPELVLRALLHVNSMNEVPPAPWRPDNVVVKANLAIMLRGLLTTSDPGQQGSEQGYHALEQLESHFPTTIAGPEFDMETFEMCLDIQTQLTIARLTASAPDPRFDGFAVIESVFFDEDRDYKHFDALHLETTDLDLITVVTERVDELGEPFKNNSFSSPYAAIAALRAEHRWDEFIKRVLNFYMHRKATVEKHIRGVGGVAKIKASLEAEVQRRDLEREAEAKTRGLVTEGATGKAFAAESFNKLKKRKSKTGNGIQSAPVALMLAPPETMVEEDHEWQPTDDEQEDGQPSAQETAGSVLQAMDAMGEFRNVISQKGKQRSFVDAQPNAGRVVFDETQGMQEPTSIYEQPLSAPGPYHSRGGAGKRSHAQMESSPLAFDPTQDEGFQTDVRDTTTADERRAKAPRSLAPNSRPSAHISQPQMNVIDYGASSNYNPNTQRKNPGASMPDAPIQSAADSSAEGRQWSYAQAKVQARAKSIMATQNRPPQVRTPWSQAEENALISLIQDHGGSGIKYSALKAQDNALGEDAQLKFRDAEQIRFKARNMKVTMLLAGAGLPPNWDYVLIDKKAMDKLANRGIPYDQTRVRASNKGN